MGTTTRRVGTVVAGIGAGAVFIAGVAVATGAPSQRYSGCLSKPQKIIYNVGVNGPSAPHCKVGDAAIKWNQSGVRGPAGPRGATGKRGLTGHTGPRGPAGPAGSPSGLYGTGTQAAAEGHGQTCTLGEILLTASAVAVGLPAKGQTLAISQNTALFSLIGTTYGGNGISTFKVPDLTAEAPNHMTYSICVAGIYPTTS